MSHITKEKVLEDVRGLRYLYGLKYVIRYAESRAETDYTESVAEHVYGMHLIAQFFLPLISETKVIDRAKVYEMITIHDIDEVETGDIIGYLKTEQQMQAEIEASKKVIAKSPKHMRHYLSDLAHEYDKKESIEARFVKAVDKFEPLIHLYSEGGKEILHRNKTTIQNSVDVKEKYIAPFPIMYCYYQHIHNQMIEEGYFLG